MLGRSTLTLLLLISGLPAMAQTAGSVTGQITDETGASIPAADVSVLKAGAIVRTVQTNEQGIFTAPNIPVGTYSVRVSHFGFTPLELKLPIAPGQRATLNAQLKLQAEAQSVTVQGEAIGTVSVDASQNANALVLKQAEIDALPDDPDDLASDLQQLAGPAAGPNGGQIYIDGFTGGRLPPKESIREIRINQNPFSAEYDRLGYGRIEILTKPGTDKLHGQAFFNDSDGVFNARNPFLTTTPDFSSRQFGGNVGGALGKKASFFFDFERRNIDDSAVIATEIVNSSLNIVPFNTAIATPQRRTTFSPRIDYQLNSTNTLVVKYNFEHNTILNNGIGQFSLANQGSNNTEDENSIQVTETAVLNAKAINETRFRWLINQNDDQAVNPATQINVSSAFVTGGSSTASSNVHEQNFELQNYTSITQGTQAFKFGIRVRSYQVNQRNPANFLGSYLFAGGPGETSIQQYILAQEGLATPSQFSISTGNPNASIAQADFGLFFQDDWRVKPNLTVNFGLRYETQNQISDYRDFAPRVGFAWSPDSVGNKQGKTVIRGGSGIFYDRFDYNLSLNGEIYNGITEQRYLVPNPTFYPNIPSLSSLTAVTPTINQVDPNLHAPYVIQSALGIERALPKNSKISINYLNTRGIHQLLTRNINAPDPFLNNAQPYGAAAGNIYNYESTGIFNQNQLIVTVNTSFNPAVSLFSFYQLNFAKSNTDGVGTFPSNQYDLSEEYGRARFDNRHRIFLGGSLTARYGVRLSPFIVYRSSGPFNITSGDDYLGSSLFNERPSFTTLPCGTMGVYCTSYGKFDLIPRAGETIIPRNYGDGPSFFSINLRASKTWGFGEKTRGASGGPGGGGPGGFGGGGFGRPGGGGGRGGPGGGMFGDSSSGRKYSLTLNVQARNLFNTVNYANPIGVITSPLFGTSNQLANFGPGGSSANNRRLEFGLRFAF